MHIKSIHEERKDLKCSICNSLFARQATLRSHIKTHEKHKPFQCKTCDNCFTSKFIMEKHISAVHEGKKAL